MPSVDGGMEITMKLRSKLAIICAKSASLLSKKLKKGSGATFPGYIAFKIDPDILHVMADMVREKIIVTMGTNGKTTTNSILYHAIKAEGYKVIYNNTGANMLNGIISAFVLATDRHGHLDADYACIEVDELASVHVLPYLKPDYALLTNISRDQLDRFGDIDVTFHKIKQAYDSVPNAVLIINGDEPLSYSLAIESKHKFVTYGINEQIFDDVTRSEIRESTFCHFCGAKLDYDFYHYGHLGKYSCPHCNFERPVPDFLAHHIKQNEDSFDFICNEEQIHSATGSSYNIYNTLSAYAGLQVLGITTAHFKKMIASFDYGNKRESIFTIQGSKIQLHLAKNPMGFQQKISLILKDDTPKDIIILINDGYQDGRDVSWLWDVDFQYLAQAHAASITTAGTRRYDMGLRLKYEDIPYSIAEDTACTIPHLLEHGTGNIYFIVNYTGLHPANHLLHKLEKGGTRI